MNYRSILKDFDKSIVEENKRLMDMYNKILSESGCCECGNTAVKEDEKGMVKDKPHNLHDMNECDTPTIKSEDEKGMVKDKPHNLHDMNECDAPKATEEPTEKAVISAKKFFEAEEEVDGVEDDQQPVNDQLEEDDMLTATEFLKGQGETGDDVGVTPNTEDPEVSTEETPAPETTDEANKEMTASSIFGEDEEETEKSDAPTEEPADAPAEEPKAEEEPKEEEPATDTGSKEEDSIKEFFAESEPVEKPVEKPVEEPKAEEEPNEETPVEESEPEVDEDDLTDKEKDLKSLQESTEAIRMFVKANRRFFG